MGFHQMLATSIRDARIAKGMTQLDLAQQIGVTANCISQYETAKRMPSVRIMSCMSHVLDVSLDDIVPYEAHDMPHDPNQTMIFDILEGE